MSMHRQKKKRHISFHEAAVDNAKKALQAGDSEQTAMQLMSCIEVLFNYLSINEDSIRNKNQILKEFERLTSESISKVPGDSILRVILRDHGWNGVCFHYNNYLAVDTHSLLKVLGTLYLSKSKVAFTDDNSVIKSFCPDVLVSCLRNQVGLNKALSASFYGTCMLVDISGFTKLSATLCTQGSAGLDDLHLAINGYLGRCVQIVYAHGGDGKIAFAYVNASMF
jgi:hypothetical protein